MSNSIGKVLESTPGNIIISIDDYANFEVNKNNIQVGRYLQIQEGNLNYVVVQIQNVKTLMTSNNELSFIVSTRPIGMLDENNNFVRGGVLLPVPTEPVFILQDTVMQKIYTDNTNMDYEIGALLHNPEITYKLNGNKLFSKHIAVVGATGSGKSCAVARILQNALGIEGAGENKFAHDSNNTHIVIFDIHSEYAAAFTLDEKEQFNLSVLDVDSLILPYWLMNADELESLFIESHEQNSHNQISQFKNAVIWNKEKHNPNVNVTYDTPVYFSIKEVLNYIINMNNEVLAKTTDDYNKPKLQDGTTITREEYFDKIYDFAEPSQSRENKATGGPFRGEFDRFILRLETRLSDKRLTFLLDPKDKSGNSFKTEHFETIIKQLLGYANKSNVAIIDLSGIPFEVLSITVSLVSRIIFDFCFHYSKLKHTSDLKNDIPVMLVCEEAHNYVPQSGGADYNASKKSIERIAKEGRKYGISAMIVSQRPSEVSETIFAQCNNFIALRLNNDNDQNYIKRLLPENDASVADILPNLGAGEALVVGDASLLPSLVKLKMPSPEPKSESIDVYNQWRKPWIDPVFEDVIKRWRKE